MKTQIFDSYEDFLKREDSSINGMTPVFARHHFNTQDDAVEANRTNEGCWNCRGCTNCVLCIECRDCEGCQECRSCSGCKTCWRCEECEQSRYCRQCRVVTNSSGCIACEGCGSCYCCNNCSQCEDCRHCERCFHCNYCYRCKEVYQCNGYRHCKSIPKDSKHALFIDVYNYVSSPRIHADGSIWIQMGCFLRPLKDWKKDFWNNPGEFPNDGGKRSEDRLLAFKMCLTWIRANKPKKKVA